MRRNHSFIPQQRIILSCESILMAPFLLPKEQQFIPPFLKKSLKNGKRKKKDISSYHTNTLINYSASSTKISFIKFCH
ncbi:unnamed protein product [Onchocerca flexuosa]|uniref:Ovule protein n=1 Tax=Onchocerca flexuosa TaxID=387005 RepID=A0A183HV25_9BILA|nr:unnamed protein product [Onchocerca flexuosa]